MLWPVRVCAVLVIDPVARSVSLLGHFTAKGSKWNHAVSSPLDGKTYGLRSTMVGDRMIHNGTVYVVANAGFYKAIDQGWIC